MLNISGERYFRYKMPSMEIEIHDSKTVIYNMDEVMQALDRPLEYIVKFLVKLGIEITVSLGDVCTMNGEYSREILESLLYKFIEEYVLCPKCKCPSTNFIIKRKVLHLYCALCNEKSPILNPCKYILKSEIDKGSLKVYSKF